MGLLRNLREVVGSLKHHKSYAKLCPRCGSPQLKLSSRFDIWLLPEQYLCGNCGYRGPIILEMDEEETDSSGINQEAADPAGALDSCNDSEP